MTAKQLKALRTQLHLTQPVLAEKLGVHSMSLSRWETGQRPIPLMAVKLLAYIAREAGVKMPARK